MNETEYIPTVFKNRRVFITPNEADKDKYVFKTYGGHIYDCTMQIDYTLHFGQVTVINNKQLVSKPGGNKDFYNYSSSNIENFFSDWDIIDRRVLIEKIACV